MSEIASTCWSVRNVKRGGMPSRKEFMAVVKRSPAPATKTAGALAPVKRRKASLELPEVTLPEGPSEISDDLRDFSHLIHGDKKIGKTSLFAQEKGAFFIEFDPPQRALAIHQVFCPDWPHFLAYLEKLEAGHKYRTIVIDRVDLMYVRCMLYVCEKLGIDHPQDLGYGKGWDAVRKEFQNAVVRLMGLAPTRWISHSTVRESESREGQKIDRLVPDFPKQADSVLTGLMDITAAYTYKGKERLLIVGGDETIVAGHRVSGHFMTPKGRKVKEIPMGDSPEEGYGNFLTAFANKQVFTTLEERDAKKGGDRKKQ